MSGVYVRPFKASDLDAFVPVEPLLTDKIKEPELAQAIEDSGLARTGLRDGKIFGCGGVHPIDDFHGEVWLRLSDDCVKHKVSALRWIIEGMRIIEETYPFKQLNAVVKDCYETGIKLVEYLGFQRVQLLDHDGQQWFVYSKRVKE
ncbi:hypothetical protein KAR91_50830 [Candidatus Pacearchaeota archaeon]|nr:hypothetical protein [Candidatus Pacearchaeota archaeon]